MRQPSFLASIDWSLIPEGPDDETSSETDLSVGVEDTQDVERDTEGEDDGEEEDYVTAAQQPNITNTAPQPTQPAIEHPGDADQRPFKLYGAAVEAFYDRSPIVGLEGPAGTGKSRTALEKVHLLMEKYPGARALIARKTRESISEAALFTYEQKVVPEGHPVLNGPARSHRTVYTYPNGSMIVVCGLDKPKKIMSTEFDIAYVQEAVECTEEDFELITTRLRNGVIPYNQLIFDCNPDKPTHWIWQKGLSGEIPLHKSFHEDNPTLWQEAPPDVQQTGPEPKWPLRSPDGRVGRYTPGGEQYLAKLDTLTGARYKRLRKGLWVSSEGGVYEEEWDSWSDPPASNLLPPLEEWPPLSQRRVWGCDFGYTAPLSIGKFTMDGDGRLELYQELYHTHMLVEDAAREIIAVSGWSYDPDGGMGHRPLPGRQPDPLPEVIVCDTDAEGAKVLEKHTGIRCINAYKGMSDGIEAMKARMRKAGDGRPRLYMRRGAVIRRDPELKEQSKPQCTVEEVDGYVWAPAATGLSRIKGRDERPLGIDDHGMDMTKYVVCYVDGINGKVKAADVARADLAGGNFLEIPGGVGFQKVPVGTLIGVSSAPMNKSRRGESLVGGARQSTKRRESSRSGGRSGGGSSDGGGKRWSIGPKGTTRV